MSRRDAEKQLQQAAEDIDRKQKDLSSTVMAMSRLETQLSENQNVLEELQLHTADSSAGGVYKMLGPTLIKQDPAEAVSNVSKRIEFIQGEIKRHEEMIESKQKDVEAARTKAMALKAKLDQMK